MKGKTLKFQIFIKHYKIKVLKNSRNLEMNILTQKSKYFNLKIQDPSIYLYQKKKCLLQSLKRIMILGKMIKT